MRRASIRLRLTGWYFAVLAIALGVFGTGMFLTLRQSVHAAADDELSVRLQGMQRFNKAHSRDMGGAGLGLSIARWIVDAHHAGIQVESSPGRGSVFRVSIPLEKLSGTLGR